MNIFILDYNLEINVQYYCDKHIVKMLTETCQILCTVYRETYKGVIPNFIYKSTHKNHPCIKWCSESYQNFLYLCMLGRVIYNEYQYRYNKPEKHQRNKIILDYFQCKDFMINLNISKGLTVFPLAMPDKYKCDDAVKAYRAYYLGEKTHLFKWTKRGIPSWIK